MGRPMKHAKDAARHASKARGPAKPKPIESPHKVTFQEEPANFEKRGLLREIALCVRSGSSALALAKVISHFTLADYSTEELERAVFRAEDLSKFPYDVMMKRGLRAPPEHCARLLALVRTDREQAEREIESFARQLICWSPGMAMSLAADSQTGRMAVEEKAQGHYQYYVATIGKDEKAPKKFAKAIIGLAQIEEDAALALLRGDLGGASALIRGRKTSGHNGFRSAAATKPDVATIHAAFEWAEAIWCCFDLQWNVAFWRQKYRNGLSPIILTAKVRQSWAVIREVFSHYLKFDLGVRRSSSKEDVLIIDKGEQSSLEKLIKEIESKRSMQGAALFHDTLSHPFFAKAALGIQRLLQVIDAKSPTRAVDIFLEDIPLAIALLAAALRFEQAERTRKARVTYNLSGRNPIGLSELRLSDICKASFERAHTISLYLRCSVGDFDPDKINPPPASDKAPPACRISKTDRKMLGSLIHVARDHSGQFDNLVDREGQQSLMDVVDQSVRYRWAPPRCNSV